MKPAEFTGKDFEGHHFNLWDPHDWPPSRYGNWRTTKGRDGRYFVPEYLSGSDYSGSLVERSNVDAWREQFADGENTWWCTVHGGHGTIAIVVDGEGLTDEAKEFLCALSDYPLADEERHSEMEMEAQGAAWDDWARRDFVRALEKRFDVEDLDLAADNDQLFELFRETGDRIGEYWVNEQGDSMYINVDRIASKVSPAAFLTLTKAARQAMADNN